MKKAKAKKAAKPKATDSAMTGDELKVAIVKCGFNQSSFARLIGVGGRTVRSWISEQFPVPKTVALLVYLIQKTKTKPEDLQAS